MGHSHFGHQSKHVTYSRMTACGLFVCAYNEDSGEHLHEQSIIRAFTVRVYFTGLTATYTGDSLEEIHVQIRRPTRKPTLWPLRNVSTHAISPRMLVRADTFRLRGIDS